MAGTAKDLFVCHASRDKEGVARPLVQACQEAGWTCWFDEAEIKWGECIPGMINDGLARSRYVVVVLSSAFLDSDYAQRELNAALHEEARTGRVRVLPLLVGSESEKERILGTFYLLNDKQNLSWDRDPQAAVAALRHWLEGVGDKTEGAATIENFDAACALVAFTDSNDEGRRLISVLRKRGYMISWHGILHGGNLTAVTENARRSDAVFVL